MSNDPDRVEEEERLEREDSLLAAHGYKPEVWWRKKINDGCSQVCTRGEALKNIELARKKKP